MAVLDMGNFAFKRSLSFILVTDLFFSRINNIIFYL